MQTCYNCGRQVDDNVLICPDCGALVRRYGRPAPEPAAEAPLRPAQPAAARRTKRFTGGVKAWLILCIVFGVFHALAYGNLFFIYRNQALFDTLFSQAEELAPMRELLSLMMQSVSMYLWFYILEGALFLLKCAGLIWFAASGRRTIFLITAVLSGLLALVTLVTAGVMQALLAGGDVLVLWLLLRRQWSSLPR